MLLEKLGIHLDLGWWGSFQTMLTKGLGPWYPSGSLSLGDCYERTLAICQGGGRS